MYSITLYVIDIHNISCLEPFLPLYDHFEVWRFFRTELAVLAETLSYHISHDVSSASSRPTQVLRLTFKSNRSEKLTRHALPSFFLVEAGRYYQKNYQTPTYPHFFKLSANYRYRKKYIWGLAKNHRYRKNGHQISLDKLN